jgi:aconitate hydratase
MITDPRTLDMPYPRIIEPPAPPLDHGLLRPPPPRNAPRVELVKGPGHVELPDFEPIGDWIELPVLLVTGNNVTTDEIMPAGARVMSLWSNLPQLSEHVSGPLDETYVDRARRAGDTARRWDPPRAIHPVIRQIDVLLAGGTIPWIRHRSH